MTVPERSVLDDVWRCAARVVVLFARGRLHLRRGNVGASAQLPDGRGFVVFRETTCDRGELEDTVTLAVWFHLRFVPAGARIRRFVFERESILNTLLYAGFDGYRVKLWMVDPTTSDYAGLYAWGTRETAERYARGTSRRCSDPSRSPARWDTRSIRSRWTTSWRSTGSTVQLRPRKRPERSQPSTSRSVTAGTRHSSAGAALRGTGRPGTCPRAPRPGWPGW